MKVFRAHIKAMREVVMENHRELLLTRDIKRSVLLTARLELLKTILVDIEKSYAQDRMSYQSNS